MEALTREQLHALRITIAEAMGWEDITTTRDEYNPEPHLPDWHFYLIGDPPPGAKHQTIRITCAVVPDYPNDPAQIGPMLEHFRAKWEASDDCHSWEVRSYKDGWAVAVKNWQSETVGSGDATALELAICLAIADYQRNQDALPQSQDTQNGEG